MRKMKKVLGTVPRELMNKLFSKDAKKAVSVEMVVDGKHTMFSVFYQQAAGYPEKLIDVTDGVGFGPAASWSEAINMAREFAKLRPAQ